MAKLRLMVSPLQRTIDRLSWRLKTACRNVIEISQAVTVPIAVTLMCSGT